jgi:dTDP-4-amino-4,6-dideoxygalactose transaminase
MIKLTQLDTDLIDIENYFSKVKELMSSMIMGGIYCDTNIDIENKLSNFVGSPCLLTSSGTSALIMSLEYAISKADLRPIVFCVSEYLYFSIHSAINKLGHRIQILKADTDEVTVESAKYIPNHYHIFILTSHHNSNVNVDNAVKDIPVDSRFVIEDRCLVFGTKSEYKVDAACYSFSNNKMIIAGEGGLLATNNKEMLDWARLRSFNNIQPTVNNRMFMYMGNYNYIPTWPPTKFSISAIVSLLISEQLDVLPVNIQKRKENYKILNDNLKVGNDQHIPEAPLFYTLHLPRKHSKRELHRIQLNLIKENIFSQLGVLPYDYFESNKLSKGILNVPVHSGLSSNNLEHIICSINKIL